MRKSVFLIYALSLSIIFSCTATNKFSVVLDSTSAVEGAISFTVEGSIDIASILTRSDVRDRDDIITRTDITNPVNIPISDISFEKNMGKSAYRKRAAVTDILKEDFVVLLVARVVNNGDTATYQNTNSEDGSYEIELTDVAVTGSTLRLDVYLVVAGEVAAEKSQTPDESYDTVSIGTVKSSSGSTEILLDGLSNGSTINVGTISSNSEEDLITDANLDSIEDLTTSVSQEEVAASLMLHLALEECTGTEVSDISNSALTTVVKGRPIWVEKNENDPSDLGDCNLSFDGIDDSFNIITDTDFQEAAWDKGFIAARINVAVEPTSRATIIAQWDFDSEMEDGYGWFWFGLYSDENGDPKLRFYVKFVTEPVSPSNMIESSEPIAPGVWVVVSASFDETAEQNLKLYIDGVEDLEAPCSNCDFDGDIMVGDFISVGASDDADGDGISDFHFEGAIDSIQIYNEAWTQDEALNPDNLN